jgi:hypothetical protein
MAKQANTTPKVDKNLPSEISFTKGKGKSGGKRVSSISIGREEGSGRSKGARRNANIGTVC